MNARSFLRVALMSALAASCAGGPPTPTAEPTPTPTPTAMPATVPPNTSSVPPPPSPPLPIPAPPASRVWWGAVAPTGGPCDLTLKYETDDLEWAYRTYTETVLWTYSVNFTQVMPDGARQSGYGDVLGCLRLYVREPLDDRNTPNQLNGTYADLLASPYDRGVPVSGCTASQGLTQGAGQRLDADSYAVCSVHLESLFGEIARSLGTTITAATDVRAAAFVTYVTNLAKTHSPYVSIGSIVTTTPNKDDDAAEFPIVVVKPISSPANTQLTPMFGQGVWGRPFAARPYFAVERTLHKGSNPAPESAANHNFLWTSFGPAAFRAVSYGVLSTTVGIWLERYTTERRSTVVTYSVTPQPLSGLQVPFNHGNTVIYIGAHPDLSLTQYASWEDRSKWQLQLKEFMIDPASSGSDSTAK